MRDNATQIKTSRKSLLWYYFMSFLFITILVLANTLYSVSPIINYAIIAIIAYILIHIELIVAYTTFLIESERVIEINGILAKKRIAIPFLSISNTTSRKTIIGRLLDYGDVSIIEFSGGHIVMRGVDKPDDVAKKLEIMSEKTKRKMLIRH